jgi:hypothetical protein
MSSRIASTAEAESNFHRRVKTSWSVSSPDWDGFDDAPKAESLASNSALGIAETVQLEIVCEVLRREVTTFWQAAQDPR